MKWLSTLMITLSLLAFIACGIYGTARRTGRDGYVHSSVDSPSQAYHEMKSRGIRGQTVVIVSKRLYFEGVPYKKLIPEGMGFPLEIRHLADTVEWSLTDRNFAWVAVERGQARKVVHVLPRDVLSVKLDRARGDRRVTVRKGRIDIPFFGALRSIVSVDSLPFTAEPVVLIVDASFFGENGDMDEGGVLANGVRPFLIISCPLEDDETITDAQRDALKEFVSLMEQRHG